MAKQGSDTDNRPTVGWVGIGDQGGPMATKVLEAGYSLAVWARNPDKAQRLAEAGAKVVGDVVELGQLSQVVELCVLDDVGVEEVLILRGLLRSLAPGSVVLVHSTVSPTTCIRLASEAADGGVSLLDAPVSGGGEAARLGKLSVMVGGDLNAFLRVEPIVRSFGEPVRHVGPVGCAQALKIINNGLFVANLGNAWNALALAERFGVPRDIGKEVLGASSGRSIALKMMDSLILDTEWGRHSRGVLARDVELLGQAIADASIDEASLLLPSVRAAALALLY